MTHQEQRESFLRRNRYQGSKYRRNVFKHSRGWTREAALGRSMDRTSPSSLIKPMSLNITTSEGREEGVIAVYMVGEAVYEEQYGDRWGSRLE
jgi:hypothetical protein